MQPKKNPKADLTKSSGLFFAIGFALISALTYAAFEVKSYDRKDHGGRSSSVDNVLDEDQEEFVMEEITPVTPPPPEAPVVEDIKTVEDEKDVEENFVGNTEVNKNEAVIPVDDIKTPEEPVDEDIDVPFAVIEDKPMFEACKDLPKAKLDECFKENLDRHVKKTLVYPQSALDMGIQGRVSVSFRINKDGSVTVVGVRGPDRTLEAEARRVIEKMPKVIPGKQRGRPTAVLYSYPIFFKMN